MTERSIADINARAFAAKGHDIELEYPKGKGLGVFVTVLGDQAQMVEDFEIKLADKRIEQSIEKATRSTKDILADNVERAVVRVTGWRGIKEAFSAGLLRTFLGQNPDFVDQILEASRNRGNFTSA